MSTAAKKSNSIRNNEFTLLKAALEAATDGILIVSVTGRIVYYNQTFSKIWKIPAKLLATKDSLQIIHYAAGQLKYPREFLSKTLSLVEHPELECSDELYFNDGRIFERNIKPHRIKERVIGRIISFRDITAYRRHDAELIEQATHDALTGLVNRSLLMEHLHQAIGYARRTNLLFGVMFVDLDRYKKINDNFGHVFGDEVLKDVAQRLQNCIRENDTIIRLGGDEFIILVTTLHAKKDIIPVAKKIIANLGRPFIFKDKKIVMTASIGISFYDEKFPVTTRMKVNNSLIRKQEKEKPEQLLRQADEAMYLAKKQGGNNFQFYEE